MSLVASLDLGSNTLRLLIAEAGPGPSLRPVLLERRVTRLSQNLVPGGRLFPAARERTLKVLDQFGRLAAERQVEDVFGGATAVIRLAADGDDFLAEVKRRTGLSLRKLSGGQEARLTALGVLSSLNGETARDVLIIDPGGQSTEFVTAREGRPGAGLSLNLGVVSLTERFLDSDPPAGPEMAVLRAEVVGRIEEALAFCPPRPGLSLAGTAGTVTTIAAMLLELAAYDPQKVTGFQLARPEVSALLGRLNAMPLASRRGLAGLEPGREDVIIAGLVMVESIMEAYGQNQMAVVDSGLLEGLILDGLGRRDYDMQGSS